MTHVPVAVKKEEQSRYMTTRTTNIGYVADATGRNSIGTDKPVLNW